MFSKSVQVPQKIAKIYWQVTVSTKEHLLAHLYILSTSKFKSIYIIIMGAPLLTEIAEYVSLHSPIVNFRPLSFC